MVRLYVSVPGIGSYQGKPQIVRKLRVDDKRTLEQYAHDLVADVPEDEKELDALVRMYETKNYPGGCYYFRVLPDKPVKTDNPVENVSRFHQVNGPINSIDRRVLNRTIQCLVEDGNDIYIIAQHDFLDIPEENDQKDYYFFLESAHEANVEKYREWQTMRMQQSRLVWELQMRHIKSEPMMKVRNPD